MEKVEETRKILSQMVKKTPLTEKLLSRPPFRYIHDLSMEIISVSGFAQSLFNNHEKESSNVTDKEEKLKWLQKLIDFVQVESGQKVRAKPARIVAGLEVDETCAFLQLFCQTALEYQKSGISASTSTATSTINQKKQIADKKSVKKQVKQSHVSATSKDKLPDIHNQLRESIQIPSKLEEPVSILARPATSAGRRPPQPSTSSTQQAQILDSKQDNQKETQDEPFVILPFSSPDTSSNGALLNTESGKETEHGLLVKKILETNKELADTDLSSTDPSTTSVSSRIREKQAIIKEIASGRDLIQRISRDMGPLTQILDFYQEDMDAIVKEMDTWKSEYIKYSKLYEQEMKITNDEIGPLKSQLLDQDELLAELVVKIDETKAKILDNTETIQKLMGNMVGSSNILK